MPYRYAAEVEIDAPPRVVWRLLTDLPRYGEWSSFTPRARGELAAGAVLWLQVRLLGGVPLWQRMVVENVAMPTTLIWTMRWLGGWLIRARRTQRLQPLPGGGTRYLNEDVIDGILAPLVDLLFGPRLSRGFVRLAAELKHRAEGQARSRAQESR